jgi:hypothetical protein
VEGGATALRGEQETCTISPDNGPVATPGRFADFVALSEDLLTIDPAGIKDLHITGTVIGGDVAFEHADGLSRGAAAQPKRSIRSVTSSTTKSADAPVTIVFDSHPDRPPRATRRELSSRSSVIPRNGMNAAPSTP